MIVAGGVIACNGTIQANGGSVANGYAGGGSGGAIRLVSPQIEGAGILSTVGGGAGYIGGIGRIRLEIQDQESGLAFTGQLNGDLSVIDDAPTTPLLWADTDQPTVRIVSVNGVTLADSPYDPHGRLMYPHQDVYLDGTDTVDVVVQASNLPPDAVVKVRLTPVDGDAQGATASSQGGDLFAAQFTDVGSNIRALQAIVLID